MAHRGRVDCRDQSRVADNQHNEVGKQVLSLRASIPKSLFGGANLIAPCVVLLAEAICVTAWAGLNRSLEGREDCPIYLDLFRQTDVLYATYR